jgi:hypothetical protein
LAQGRERLARVRRVREDDVLGGEREFFVGDHIGAARNREERERLTKTNITNREQTINKIM